VTCELAWRAFLRICREKHEVLKRGDSKTMQKGNHPSPVRGAKIEGQMEAAKQRFLIPHAALEPSKSSIIVPAERPVLSDRCRGTHAMPVQTPTIEAQMGAAKQTVLAKCAR
jgi:hypothetical protein